jgi:hypothetical protein
MTRAVAGEAKRRRSYNRTVRPRTLAYAAAGLALAIASAAGAATSPLAGFVLKPSELGRGYKLHQRSDGHGVKYVTMDLCAYTFPSEALRTGRLQVDYERTAKDMAFSNEIVSYRPGKAEQAIGEARYAAVKCPAKPRVSPYGGPAITWKLTALKDPRLLRGYVAVHINGTAIVKGKRQTYWGAAVYQVHGDVLSGVYAFPGKKTTPAQLDRAALAAAEASASRLQEVK